MEDLTRHLTTTVKPPKNRIIIDTTKEDKEALKKANKVKSERLLYKTGIWNGGTL